MGVPVDVAVGVSVDGHIYRHMASKDGVLYSWGFSGEERAKLHPPRSPSPSGFDLTVDQETSARGQDLFCIGVGSAALHVVAFVPRLPPPGRHFYNQ